MKEIVLFLCLDLNRKGRQKILNENRKDLCFYSTEIECNWEGIRCSIGEIGEDSPGLFLHTVD